MRHSYFGKKLSRSKNERRRLLQNLARDLFIHGKIKTTLAKAKAVQSLVEKLITNAKKSTNAGTNQVRKVLADKKSVDLLLSDVKTRFASRNSGYTRIIKLGTMRSDAATEVLISFVDEKVVSEVVVEKKIKTESPKVKTADKLKNTSKVKPEKKTVKSKSSRTVKK
jgi:large subunit ribosomal protein L17